MLTRAMAINPKMEPTIAPTGALPLGGEALVGVVGAEEETGPDAEGVAVVVVRLNFEAALGRISAAL